MTQLYFWQPSAPIAHLTARAQFIRQIRDFFYARNIIEVETPILIQSAVTDVYLDSFHTLYENYPGSANSKLFALITSPEYHMKRLIAAGMGAIFQITKCFRNESAGRYHNPEFTLLEWYRPGFGMDALLDEVDSFFQHILGCPSADRLSYQDAFCQYLNCDPFTATINQLCQKIDMLKISFDKSASRDDLLRFLFTFGIEPYIGKERPIAIHHFPASQAALAAISATDARVANRFEFYYKGVELANGFEELTSAKEQRRRFLKDNEIRQQQGLPKQPLDEYFLSALEAGMPETAGVAVGIDRLIMLAINASKLSDVISFNVERA